MTPTPWRLPPFDRFGTLAALLLSLAVGMPAAAQTLTVAGACVRQCGAASRTVRDNPPEVQACLIRCKAGQDYARGAGTGAARPRPTSSAAPTIPRAATWAAPAPLPAAPGGWGVVYLAAAPGGGFGLSIGADRMAAHGAAMSACAGRGAPCRAALEFRDRCGAVAQARHTLGLFRTGDPASYSVSYAAAGAGTTSGEAEAAALAGCRASNHAGGCEIAISRCGQP